MRKKVRFCCVGTCLKSQNNLFFSFPRWGNERSESKIKVFLCCMLYRKRGRSRLWWWKITVWRDEITGTKMQVLFSWRCKRGTNSYMHHAEVWISGLSEMRNFQLGKKSIPRSISFCSLSSIIWSRVGRYRDQDDLVVVPGFDAKMATGRVVILWVWGWLPVLAQHSAFTFLWWRGAGLSFLFSF